jgi:hypothetical protein
MKNHWLTLKRKRNESVIIDEVTAFLYDKVGCPIDDVIYFFKQKFIDRNPQAVKGTSFVVFFVDGVGVKLTW